MKSYKVTLESFQNTLLAAEQIVNRANDMTCSELNNIIWDLQCALERIETEYQSLSSKEMNLSDVMEKYSYIHATLKEQIAYAGTFNV